MKLRPVFAKSAIVLSIFLCTSTNVRGQTEEAFQAQVEGAVERLPSVWETEVAEAVAQSWSSEALACIRDVDIVVDESADPLVVRYENDRIVLSRGYLGLVLQATSFTFLTLLGAIPDDDLSVVLDRSEAVLQARRAAYQRHRDQGAPAPSVFVDYGYLLPYQGRLNEAMAATTIPQVELAANVLNGGVLFFALLHEAGHHAYRYCRATVRIDPDLHEERWADQFALNAFRNESYPTLLAFDAVRVLDAYKGDDNTGTDGSLECRLGVFVDQMETPDPAVFTTDGLDAPDAPTFAANLSRLIPQYLDRYPPSC